MHQTFFPVFPKDSKMINSDIGLKTVGEMIIYYNGGMPVYQHRIDDYKGFRYFTSMMIDLKNVSHEDIISTFKVSKESVNRWLRTYRTEGGNGFFQEKKSTKRGTKLTDEVLVKVQGLLNLGKTPKEIGAELDIKRDTIQKAISAHRLTKPSVPAAPLIHEKTQSERSKEDSAAVLGVGCTNVVGRIEAIQKKK
jgi:hypothetical protein